MAPKTPFTGFVEFVMEDAMLLDLDEFDIKRREAMADWLEIYYQTMKLGTCWTLIIEDEIVGVAGAIPIKPGVVEIWNAKSKLADKYPVRTLVRQARSFIDKMVEKYGAHRVQSIVHADDKRSLRWDKALGLEPEGLMEAYGEDGSNYYICAKIKGRS